MQVAYFLLAAVLVALQLQESSAGICYYRCNKSYRYSTRCGFFGWRRCSRTGYRWSTCQKSCTHGNWTPWTTTYSSCSRPCGGGVQGVTKRRSCTNPRPANGGNPCSGPGYSYTSRRCNTHNCPINGGWSLWSSPVYGACSKTCGGGTKTKTYTRTCTNPTPRYGGRSCSGSVTSVSSVRCNTQNCPINGVYTRYTLSSTGSCSATCGGGTQQLIYSRTCTNPSPRYGGRPCSGPSRKSESRACNTHNCPIDGEWTDYTLNETSSCTVSCGGGTKTLTYIRSCTNPRPQYGGEACTGRSTKIETEECNTQHCPIHGGYSPYTLSNTGACSVTCGGGTQQLTYSRTCTNPSPRYGGRLCSAPSTKTESQSCNTQHCPINGGWSDYSLNNTGECSVSCGGGSKILTYIRTCTNPAPQYGGDECRGEESKEESEDCNTHHCPIHGEWSEFALTNTGDCSVTCGGGEKSLTYTRSCTNPAPQYGGNDCDGSDTRIDTEDCNENPCPVNGGWTAFSAWQDVDECDVLCGGGYKDQTHERSCTNPSPAYGGDECEGEISQTQNITCNSDDCGDKCPTGQVKFHPHASNLYKYYQCAHGIARLRDCAPGTMWSQTQSVCINIPVAADEVQEAPTHAPVSTSCTAAGGLIADPNDCHRYRMCLSGTYISMPCAAGTGFNPAISNCDLLANVPNCS